MKAADLCWLGVSELAAGYRARRFSPVDVTRALVARIERHDGLVNAFIRVDAEGALAAAKVAEHEIHRGRARGPLHGVPVGLKDNIDVAGVPTTCHSKLMLDHVPSRDADVVAHLRSEGAIILGKQSLHEFAFGGPSPELPFPHAKHPWSLEYHPGGSSSGSGAALAAGFTPVSIGTDAGGSIRNPAGSCGLVGLKPTHELLSRDGVFPVSQSCDHVGPMGRRVADVALTLDAAMGRHEERRRGTPTAATLEDGLRGLRIGFVRHFHERDMIADPQVVGALDEAVRVLEAEGASVRDVTLPKLQELAAVQRVILISEAWRIHAHWLRTRPADYTTPTRRKVMAGAFLTAGHLINAQMLAPRLKAAVDAVFAEVDVLLTAAAFDPVAKIVDQAELLRTYARHARSPFNLTGHPAVAMMAGLATNGLPLSLQFVGPWNGEAMLLRAARGYERATNWRDVCPRPFD